MIEKRYTSFALVLSLGVSGFWTAALRPWSPLIDPSPSHRTVDTDVTRSPGQPPALLFQPLVGLDSNLSGGQARGIASCQILNRAMTRYVLERNVSSPGTCFSIQADNITLDLNHLSLVYGAKPSDGATFGILGIACWDGALRNGIANGTPCGGSFNGFTVLNGKITQSPGVAPFSDAIHLGQGGGNRLQVHDVEFTVQGDSSIPIYTNYSGAGSVVRNNIIHNNVRTIQSRHQLQGMSVKFDNSTEVSPGQSVYENKIFGGPQGGILLVTDGAVAHGNEIRQNGHYSNDFAIYMWGNREEVYNNVIDAVSGRGIQIGGGAVGVNGRDIGGKRSNAHDNKIQVIELQQNCEYGEGASQCSGCQLGGAYGIQFDDNPQDDSSFNNTVLARADACDAGALRITDSRVRQNESRHEFFAALRSRPNSPGNAYGWDNAGPKGFTARDDVFVADTASYHVNWDGAQNELCISCTFGKGTANPSPDYVTFSFQNGGKIPVRNIHFQDPKFLDGARKDSTDMKPVLANQDWPGPSEYFVDWTFTLSVDDQHQKSVAGAEISIRDALGRSVYQGKTNLEGRIAVPLTEFRMYNTASQVLQERHNPYQVTVAGRRCGAPAISLPIEVTETTVRTVDIACKSN
jgi:hypothetical protein